MLDLKPGKYLNWKMCFYTLNHISNPNKNRPLQGIVSTKLSNISKGYNSIKISRNFLKHESCNLNFIPNLGIRSVKNMPRLKRS